MDVDLSLAGSRLVFGNHPGPTANARIISPAPMLERFRFRTSSRVYEREERYIFGVFQDVPRLNALHISRVPELDLLGNSNVGVPWHQLSTLTLDYVPSVGTTLHLLSKCDRLQEFSFKADALFGPLPEEPVVHTWLKRLTVSVGNEHFTAFFERSLTVCVRGSLDTYGWEHAPFEGFLSRSTLVRTLQHHSLQELEELVIDDRRDWTWEPFVKDLAFDLLNCALYTEAHAVLALLDGVYILVGGTAAPGDNEPGGDGGSGDEEASSRRRTCFLPKLKELTVRGNCLDTMDGTIADMVESRFYFREGGVEQLRSVRMDIPSNHLGDIQRLKAMQAEGLHLELDFI
ncbi:hypothetical protein FA13DRAFT_1733672 [Coprinellus micaceus]|uniref:Uncharacterized protein n=1 Tax=Coprinellus micaceus TaxID=71717 RepID=A0A4Y7T8Q0_COPMI|nr:hypothetical protein FA13DRAFT_1733672 [Coprinellus micaceus]